ncbi:lovastatin nonaketide synthase [Rhypophila decipiens]|uniref:Lovastatin nonaketide synthase n=1 Tax=Rhypophila decipiens TaxID=261697 RepID=A0AAN6YAS6_9PEZI|nr:lovastatin nonaketide synthase [Rhypophila decipiens]
MRLPGGCNTASQFWDLLMSKKEGMIPVPPSRWNLSGFHDSSGQLPGTIKSQEGNFLGDLDLGAFDGNFWSLPSAQVEQIDPQHRILLETVYEAVENAGDSHNTKGKKVGVYVGVFAEDWIEMHSKDSEQLEFFGYMGHFDLGASNLVSYEFDWRGPSMTFKTGCSASLVALDTACKALAVGDCEAAVVGGTNLILSPGLSTVLSAYGVNSPEGRSRPFDATANGYGRAEAVSALYIKRLDDAIRDGNPIRAVIRASMCNDDGKTQGITQPSSNAQEALIRAAYKSAGLSQKLGETGYFECHGTGTPVGDPMEAGAVARVFGESGGMIIGSVKSNVGHSEAASGNTSIIKSILALEHRMIPPTVNFNTPNPKIPFKEANLVVPTEPLAWPQDRQERVSINSFGIGGSNAHVILESASAHRVPQQVSFSQDIEPPRLALLLLSAKSDTSLQASVEAHTAYLAKNGPSCLADLSYTLAARHEHHQQRTFAIAYGDEDDQDLEPTSFSQSTRVPSECRPIIFIFTGQGAQWAEMGKELIQDFPEVEKNLREMGAILAECSVPPDWKILEEISKPKSKSRISKAEFSQPLCTALQIVLVDLLQSWGVTPQAVAGHSSGEIAAAYAAGSLSKKDAILAAYFRGYATRDLLLDGAMAAVGLGADEVRPYLDHQSKVVVACENSPESSTISGDAEAVQSVISTLRRDAPEVFVRGLQVDNAYHSHHMKAYGEKYEEHISFVHSSAPTIPFFSSVSGKQYNLDSSPGTFDAPYWRANLECPVLFHTAVKNAIATETLSNNPLVVEIGPHSALAGPLRQIFASSKSTKYTYVPTLQRGKDATECLLTTFGTLWTQNTIPAPSSMSSFPIISPNTQNAGRRVLTDLPSYQWDHTKSYWLESRHSREWRNRQFLPHEILGTRLPGTSGLEPTWRNLLTVSKIPWVNDHLVGSDVVMPGLGYVAMAGEAIRYTVRALAIKTAMILHDSKDKENDVLTTLRKAKLTAKDGDDSPWWEFNITSFNGSVWSEHCRGQVRAGVSQSPAEKNDDEERFVRKVSANRWYKTLQKIGFSYGPTFRGLSEIAVDPITRESVAVVENVSHRLQEELHPCEMDKMLQLVTVTQHAGDPTSFKQLAMPTYFEEIAVGAGFSGRERFKVSASSQFDHMGTWSGNLSARLVDESGERSNRNKVFEIKGLSVSAMGSSAAEARESKHKNSVELVWQPDITFLSSEEIAPLIRTPLDLREQQLALEKYFVLLALETVPLVLDIETSQPHLDIFRSWLERFVATTRDGKHLLLGAEGAELCALEHTLRTGLLAEMKTSMEATPLSSLATCLSRVAETAVPRFRGEVDSISVLMEGGALTEFYAFVDRSWDYAPLLRSIGHNKPTLRVLEIGAGTGGTTSNMLRGLRCQEFDERLYLKYCYTDISAGFFVAAKERFKDHPGMEYRVLDITQDPVEQGFEEGGYDLILAANVLHATPCLQETLKNVRKLLDAKGRLLLQEIHTQFSWPGFVMGGLSGWWLGKDDGRTDGPAASPERWEDELKGAGFAGIKAMAFDNEAPFQACATMLCDAAPLVPEQQGQSNVVLLYRSDEDALPETVAQYQIDLTEAGCTVSLTNFNDGEVVQIPHGWDVISLLDLQGPFLDNISGRNLTKLLNLVSKVETVNTIWVTGLCSINVKDPRYAQILGLARTVRSERHISLTTVEVDDFAHPAAPPKIVQLYHEHVTKPDGNSELDPDYEFAVLDGVVHSSRYHWFSVPQALSRANKVTTTDKVLMVGQKGMIDSLRWEDNHMIDRPLGPGEVSIRPHTVGVNFRDVLQTQGVVDGDDLGGECSGTILQVGPGVRDEFQVDGRVFLVSSYCFSNRIIASQDVVARIPDGMSMEDAATMPIVFTTVLYSLLHLRRLEKGQTILIHSACGGVGLAAIQVARMIGARVLATVGNEDKARFLVDNYGMPRSEIFDSHSTAFFDDVLKATKGKGVDIALNSLAGELLHATWKCVAPFGAMIEIGKRDIYGHGRLDMISFTENRAFLGVDIRHIQSVKPEIIGQMLRECATYFEESKIRPIPTYMNFSASEVAEAFRHMQRGSHIGKFTVSMPENGDLSHLPTVTSRQNSLGLQPDAAYLLVGGLGGVGRSIATWLVANGARHLIFLSRSGRDARSEWFCRELEVLGANVQVFKGSVAKKEDVERVVAGSKVPIRGIIQLSMVLQDRAVDNMTEEDWYTAVRPKVDATWNLHNALLRAPLDFFVMFASTSGMFGQYGQSNYAAANCFLDAFVQYRHGLGLAASVIDLGVMEDVGFVAESANLLDYFRFLDANLLTEEDMRESVALAIARSFPCSTAKGEADSARLTGPCTRYSNPSQISIGVRSGIPLSDPSNRVVWKRDRRFAGYRSNMESGGDDTGYGADENLKSFVTQLSSRGGEASGAVESEAIHFLATEMGKTLYGFMMKEAEDMQLEKPLASLGLDSLVAIELRNWCRTQTGLDVSVLEIMQSTLRGLAEKAHTFLVGK